MNMKAAPSRRRPGSSAVLTSSSSSATTGVRFGGQWSLLAEDRNRSQARIANLEAALAETSASLAVEQSVALDRLGALASIEGRSVDLATALADIYGVAQTAEIETVRAGLGLHLLRAELRAAETENASRVLESESREAHIVALEAALAAAQEHGARESAARAAVESQLEAALKRCAVQSREAVDQAARAKRISKVRRLKRCEQAGD